MERGYGITRHIQRYEYVIKQGYVEDKVVIDVGCGHGYGTLMMCCYAKHVMGVDTEMSSFMANSVSPVFVPPDRKLGSRRFYPYKWEDVDPVKTKVDVTVAMEMIEHIQAPVMFLDFAKTIGPYLFLSTPLAEKTGPTRNPIHVVEYSHDDLVALVSNDFDILDTKYQLSDLQIVDSATPSGDSHDEDHVVQMLWCKRKEGIQ